jgi:hypothetical protein
MVVLGQDLAKPEKFSNVWETNEIKIITLVKCNLPVKLLSYHAYNQPFQWQWCLRFFNDISGQEIC